MKRKKDKPKKEEKMKDGFKNGIFIFASEFFFFENI